MCQFASVAAMAMLVFCSVAAADNIVWPPFLNIDGAEAEAETVKRSPPLLPPQFQMVVYAVSSRVQDDYHFHLYYDRKGQRMAVYSPEPIFDHQLTNMIQLCGRSMMYRFNSSYCEHVQVHCNLTVQWIPQNARLVASFHIGEGAMPVELWSYQGKSYLVEKTTSAPIVFGGVWEIWYGGDFSLKVDFSKFTPPPYCFQSRRLFLDRL
jgi:hypothetical protein